MAGPVFYIPTPAGPIEILSLSRRSAPGAARSAVLRAGSYERLAMSARYGEFVSETGPLGLVDGLTPAVYILQIARDIDGGDSWNLPVLLHHLVMADSGRLQASLAADGVAAVFATGALAFDPARPLDGQSFRADAYALADKARAIVSGGLPESGRLLVLLPEAGDPADGDAAESILRAAIAPDRLGLVRCRSVGEARAALAGDRAANRERTSWPPGRVRRWSIASAATVGIAVAVAGLALHVAPDGGEAASATGSGPGGSPSNVVSNRPEPAPAAAEPAPSAPASRPSVASAADPPASGAPAATAPAVTDPEPAAPRLWTITAPSGNCFRLIAGGEKPEFTDLPLADGGPGGRMARLPAGACGIATSTAMDIAPALHGLMVAVTVGAGGAGWSAFFRARGAVAGRSVAVQADGRGGWRIDLR